MKNKSILFSIFLILIALSLNAQIVIEKETSNETESSTQGFFVNGGSQKIETLDCYTFKDLMVSFDLKDEHFNCDGINVRLTFETEKRFNRSIASMIQKEFTELFGGKKYAHFTLFSSDDMKEWFGNLNRSRLQHTERKKYLDGSKMVVNVYRGNITGEEVVHEVVSDKVVSRTREIWKWDKLPTTTFSIELKNRIYIPPAKYFISGDPKRPVETGSCYE